MKHFTITILLLMFVITGFINAQEKQTINNLVSAVGEAYKAKTLAGLDVDKPYLGNITVIIQHSRGRKSVTKTFKSFEKVDEWLKSREKEELPSRDVFTLKQCKKGVCSFTEDGLLHNNLYLKKVTYSSSKGRYYIKTITLLDGD